MGEAVGAAWIRIQIARSTIALTARMPESGEYARALVGRAGDLSESFRALRGTCLGRQCKVMQNSASYGKVWKLSDAVTVWQLRTVDSCMHLSRSLGGLEGPMACRWAHKSPNSSARHSNLI